MITTKDIAWAAGFLEGEGSFGYYGKNSLAIQCSQVQREPLDRLQVLFDGQIKYYEKAQSSLGKKPFHRWNLYGARAAGVMMTLYVLMSPKRKAEIEKALTGWKNTVRKGGWRPKGSHWNGHRFVMDQI